MTRGRMGLVIVGGLNGMNEKRSCGRCAREEATVEQSEW